jgi:hypothetical protein
MIYEAMLNHDIGAGRSDRLWSWAPWTVLIAGTLMVVVADLSTDLPLADEWVYRWVSGR